MTVDLVAVAVLAVVSGGGKHDYARIDEAAHGATDRIVAIRIDGRHAETHVHDANVVGGAIRSYPIERAQHRSGRAEPL